jgi:hypothetical protein
LTYKLSGLEMNISEDFADRFKKGTMGSLDVSLDDIEYVKENLLNAVEQTRKDYNRGLFKNYQSYTTSTNIKLETIEDGLQFSAYHDGIHLGVVLSIKKLL